MHIWMFLFTFRFHLPFAISDCSLELYSEEGSKSFVWSGAVNAQFGVAGYKTSHNIILLAATAININNTVSITLSGVVWPVTVNYMHQSK